MITYLAEGTSTDNIALTISATPMPINIQSVILPNSTFNLCITS
jgi:hypothetical protein